MDRATIEELDAYLADGSPDAYEKVVSRLVDSSRYGEQMTRYWLAQVRHFHRDLLPNAEALRTPLVRAEAFRSLAGALLHCFPNTFLAQPAPSGSAPALPALVQQVADPPIRKLGVFELDTFMAQLDGGKFQILKALENVNELSKSIVANTDPVTTGASLLPVTVTLAPYFLETAVVRASCLRMNVQISAIACVASGKSGAQTGKQ